MRPFEHFLFAMVPVGVYTWIRTGRPPTGYTVVLVLTGALLPDIIDKPLAWTFGVLPSGRMFAHSLVISGPILVAGYLYATRRGRGRDAAVFAVAYFSHLVGDFHPILRQGTDYYFFPNLFWPLLPANPDLDPSFGAHAPDMLTIAVSLTVFLVAGGYAMLDIARRRL
jgi:membrane-bound metal-dependent hydrolase YbcI (DUF457 family)